MMEKLSTLLDADERGVSPVIGVILMVAITVILAAVIGTFVLGLGQNTQSSPQASVTISDTNADYGNTVKTAFDLSHDSGDSIKFGDLKIIIRDADSNQVVMNYDGASFTAGSGGNAVLNGAASPNGDSDYTVGDVLTFADDGDVLTDSSKYKITVIHKPSSQTVASATVQLS